LPDAEDCSQAFSLWLRADDFRDHEAETRTCVDRLLSSNPHTTLQVVLEPADPESVRPTFLAELQQTCYRRTTYLDRFYSILPGPMKGSKRVVLLLDDALRDRLQPERLEALEEFATVVWQGHTAEIPGHPVIADASR
jgi:hypothetical protein